MIDFLLSAHRANTDAIDMTLRTYNYRDATYLSHLNDSPNTSRSVPFGVPKLGVLRIRILARISTRRRERGKAIEIWTRRITSRESVAPAAPRSSGLEFNYSSRGGLWLPRQPDKPDFTCRTFDPSRNTSRCIPICLDALVFVYCASLRRGRSSSHRPIVRLGVNDRVAIIHARS